MVNTEVRLIIFFATKDGEALQLTKTRPGADCGSDHELLITKFRLKLEKEMTTHSSVLAWRIPGTGEPGGLLSMGLHRVTND